MRPVVKTALRRLWRDPTTLQIGLDPERALILGGVGDQTAELMAAFDGTRDGDELRDTARRLGLDAAVADHLLRLLVDASVVDDAAVSPLPLAGLSHLERDRLAPDLASISLLSGRLDGGIETMGRRQRATVAVSGASRVGATIGTLLAAAGIGHIVVDDHAPCRPADCAPAGSSTGDTGATRSQAAHAAIHRASGTVRTSALPAAKRPDVAVVAPAGGLAPHLAEDLMRSGTPHLFAAVRETTGVVGPFVIPGATACLRCLDLHRADRDPAWPLIAAQLATEGRRPAVNACDVVLATLVASIAALQVLNAIDATVELELPAAGTADPASLAHSRRQAPPLPTHDGTLEITLPDWRIRRRGWFSHPACGCRWPDPSEVADQEGADPRE